MPFNISGSGEIQMRTLVGNVRWMKRPHYGYIGAHDGVFLPAVKRLHFEAKNEQKLDTLILKLVPGDHFTSLAPALADYLMMVQKNP